MLLGTLKADILKGKYASGQNFPSVRALERKYGIPRSTIGHALDELFHQGLISRRQGRGTFVTSQGASRQIGLIVPGVAVTDFYGPIIREINERAHETGYTLHFKEIFSADRQERIHQVRELVAEFVKKRVAGVIFEPLAGPTGTEANEHILRVLDRAKIPVVLLDCDIVPFPERSGHDVVGTNDVEAGVRMMKHLLSIGARKIHFVMGMSSPATFDNRLYGAMSAIREWGGKCKTEVLRCDPSDAMAVKRHLQRKGRPDVFVCSNDLIAALLVQTLSRLDISVPKDVMLVGFADLPIASLMTPKLTTIRQSREQMGQMAFKRLLERIGNPSLPPTEILFPAPLIERESTMKKQRTIKNIKLKMLAVSLAGALVVGLGGMANADVVDSRMRCYVSPQRVVCQTSLPDKRYGVRAEITGATELLTVRNGQVPESGWAEGPSGCLLVNAGEKPGILLDFGREIHGGLQLGVAEGPRHMRMRVRFGESVAEAMSDIGERGATNDHAIRDDIITLPSFGTREIGNTGFRFVRLDLESTGKVMLEFVRAVELMRPMQQIGSFRCSDSRLNQIFKTAVRTVHLCCQDYLWDGIKRDRLVWMGDMHPETMAILSVFGSAEVVPQTLDYVARTTPADKWANNFPTYTLCWIRNLAAWYRFTGDRAYLEKYADYLTDVYAHVCSLLPDGRWKRDGEYGAFLDWPTHHNAEAEMAGAQALAVLAIEDLRFMAEAMGRPALAEDALRLLGKMRQVHPDPCGAKSSAALLSLSGLHDPREMFERFLGVNGHAGVSTFYGYYMIEAMSAAGEGRRALNTVRDYWGGMLDMGATSFWEDFNLAWTNNAFRIDELPVTGKRDVHGDYGDFCYQGFRHSLCHGWSCGPAAWCINRVLGIQHSAVGCKTVTVSPCLDGLEWAEGAMALPTGESVRVRIARDASGGLSTQVDAPAWVRILERKDKEVR